MRSQDDHDKYNVDFGCTPAQYDAAIAKIWKALEVSGTQQEDCFTMAAKEIKRLRERVRELELSKLELLTKPIRSRAADRLAYAVAKCIEFGMLNSRSGPADALLDYLEIGSTYGCNTVPEWMAEYERRKKNG
jgi:hypothetical protein